MIGRRGGPGQTRGGHNGGSTVNCASINSANLTLI